MGEVGLRIPLYSCAPGKAMLAALPGPELDEFFKNVTLKKFTPTTLATRKALQADLAGIRQRGYSLDLAEGMEGIHCVGAAVFDGNDFPIAAVTVIGPSFRLKESQFADLGLKCIAAAQSIRERLLA
jgi:IclR family acetate operon transcriptional repressor